MRFIKTKFAMLLLLAGVPNPSLAQPSSSGTCKVAVWTAPEINTANLGLMMGGAIDGLAKEKTVGGINTESGIGGMLPPDVLYGINEKGNISEILKSPVEFSHIDGNSQAMKDARRNNARSTNSNSECYVEIFFDRLYYQASTIYGSRIFTYMTVKDFRSGRLVKSSGYGRETLPKFTKQSLDVATSMVRDGVRIVVNEILAKKLSGKDARGLGG